jgi:hypothetical protein
MSKLGSSLCCRNEFLSNLSISLYIGVPQFAQNLEPEGIGAWQFLHGCGCIDWPQLEQNLFPAWT